jgi:hypothetical protein
MLSPSKHGGQGLCARSFDKLRMTSPLSKKRFVILNVVKNFLLNVEKNLFVYIHSSIIDPSLRSG